ncbi:Glu/Leu/Phe/Val dehydrogenase family protein [Mycetocola zhadangensis]|uniref:Glu/Leu/Phe/Val dehydrogenase family protein n=1 Tax=Mycetocola zhadangensis TaxID=1164595 RepID=A0A3L7J1K4_9MICO|nr:Glu/Leu/Phe/Val dehydrogenase family protein [Mycetocola zhadangensis]RLQ84426.1 Glu/Leu/Phe/Val dehydrogenase family protein [Mycetocola zhadangensis]GGE93118.1 leucine dehydrogenase [Mycetocola zhadangensis]
MTSFSSGASLDALHSPSLDHETVLITRGNRSGLTISVAVHSTRLGSALGGARVWHYDSWLDAVDDSLRLSAGMTLKNAAAGLARGGGKSVVFIPNGTTLDAERKRLAMLDLGDAVESLGGSYQTAEDVGTSAADMAVVAERTAHVCGLPADRGGVGEPSDATAQGVFSSIVATLETVTGSPLLSGRRATISGLGQVGSRLARRLSEEGMSLIVTDVNPARRAFAEEIHASWIAPGDEHLFETDVFVPCGVGGALTHDVIAQLRCAAVVGAANNQFADADGAELLAERGILWAPDFIANAGGVIYLDMASKPGADRAAILGRVDDIGHTLKAVFRDAAARSVTTLAAAEKLAIDRLDAAQAPATSTEAAHHVRAARGVAATTGQFLQPA